MSSSPVFLPAIRHSVALQVGSTGLPFGSFFVGENKHWVAHAAMDMAGLHLKGVNCQIRAKR